MSHERKSDAPQRDEKSTETEAQRLDFQRRLKEVEELERSVREFGVIDLNRLKQVELDRKRQEEIKRTQLDLDKENYYTLSEASKRLFGTATPQENKAGNSTLFVPKKTIDSLSETKASLNDSKLNGKNIFNLLLGKDSWPELKTEDNGNKWAVITESKRSTSTQSSVSLTTTQSQSRAGKFYNNSKNYSIEVIKHNDTYITSANPPPDPNLWNTNDSNSFENRAKYIEQCYDQSVSSLKVLSPKKHISLNAPDTNNLDLLPFDIIYCWTKCNFEATKNYDKPITFNHNGWLDVLKTKLESSSLSPEQNSAYSNALLKLRLDIALHNIKAISAQKEVVSLESKKEAKEEQKPALNASSTESNSNLGNSYRSYRR
jgi:hypothetical protein